MSKFFLLKILFTVLISITVTLLTINYAIAFSLIYFIVFGSLFCLVFGKDKSQKISLLYIFFTIFPIYIIYAGITYLGFIEYQSFFIYPDQGYFYSNILDLGKSISFQEVYQNTLVDRIHRDYEGYFFYTGIIAFIAERYFDGNSVFLQSIHSIFIGILLNLFVYKSLLYYISLNKAVKYTIAFAFFSPVFYYSPWIFRDIHIAFFYCICIYLVHKKFSLFTFFWFGLLILVTIQFRLEHGLFLFVFPMLYLYFHRKQNYWLNKWWSLVLLVSLLFFLSIFLMLLPKFQASVNTLNTYGTFTQEALNDGIGAKLYSLPQGIKQIALSINSQFTPLPPWANIEFNTNPYIIFVGFITLVTTVFWSYLFLFIFISLINKKYRGQISFKIWALLCIFFVFLLLNTANINVRRILGVYPILLILFANLNENILTRIKIKIYRIRSILIYFFLIILYLIIKIII